MYDSFHRHGGHVAAQRRARKPAFQVQIGVFEKFLTPAADLVDKIAVQTRARLSHPIIHWRVAYRPQYALMCSHRRSGGVFRLISILVSGLFVGLAARYLYPGNVPMGLGRTILLGIAGSLVAGFAASWGSKEPGINRAGCLASILGAMVVIFIARHL